MRPPVLPPLAGPVLSVVDVPLLAETGCAVLAVLPLALETLALPGLPSGSISGTVYSTPSGLGFGVIVIKLRTFSGSSAVFNAASPKS